MASIAGYLFAVLILKLVPTKNAIILIYQTSQNMNIPFRGPSLRKNTFYHILISKLCEQVLCTTLLTKSDILYNA